MTRFSSLDSGEFTILAGSINGSSGTDAVLTSYDGAASLTVNGTGDYTVDFGHDFPSSPVVTANVASTVVTEGYLVQYELATDTDTGEYATVTFNTLGMADATSAFAATDLDFSFTVMGKRVR